MREDADDQLTILQKACDKVINDTTWRLKRDEKLTNKAKEELL